MVRAYQETAAEVIHQYEGHMAQYLGDGLLIYFGWPIAHEDDAQRAAHAGLGIVEAITTNLNPRLDQMQAAKEVAQVGSVLGREFTYEMLRAVMPQDDETVQRELAQLVAGELLYHRGRPPRSTYIFKHALIQETAYASLLRSTRQQIHRQVARLLESRFTETIEAQPELVAYHYAEADDDEQAIAYWQRAGQRAIQRLAVHEAISHLSAGLEVLSRLSDTPEHMHQELEMQNQAKQQSRDALALARELEHPYSLASVLTFTSGLYRLLRDEYAIAELLATLNPIAREHGFAQRLATELGQRGWVSVSRGHIEEGIALMRQGLTDLKAMGLEIHQPLSLPVLAHAYGKLGQIDEGLSVLVDAEIAMDQTSLDCARAELYWCRGELLLSQTLHPDAHQAEACFHEALDIARQQQAKPWELRAATSLARLWQSQGKRQAAYNVLQPVYGWFTEGFDTADAAI